MKKIVIILTVVIIVAAGIICFMFLHKGNGKKNQQGQLVNSEEAYGNRGNISEVEKIKFLSKNDEYLVGMIGLPVSRELSDFTSNDMIRFALNIAQERYKDYSNILVKRTNKDGTISYLVSEKMVFDIIEEYFGLKEVSYDQTTNEYYSKTNKAFVLDENVEKTLYYYPVNCNSLDGEKKEIVADAIFISDDLDKTVIENAKYDGKYGKENVDNTIKFVFNNNGYLVSYQYE
jgi:hypothetical protein